jgi:hypothetical protein
MLNLNLWKVELRMIFIIWEKYFLKLIYEMLIYTHFQDISNSAKQTLIFIHFVLGGTRKPQELFLVFGVCTL